MSFSEQEMAILAQLAYCEVNVSVREPIKLHDFIINNADAIEKLKPDLGPAIDGLIEKTRNKDYTIVLAENDKYDSGFAAMAIRDPDNIVTVACRGSEDLTKIMESVDSRKDLFTDIQIGVKTETNQQQKLEKFMKHLECAEYDGYYFTGHSLGGNLAIHGSICVDYNKVKGVYTYNAPGFNRKYWLVHKSKIDKVNNKIDNYENEGDYVSSILTKPGETFYIKSKYDAENLGFDHHGINGFVVDKLGLFQVVKRKRVPTGVVFAFTNVFVNGGWSFDIIGDYIKARITGGALTGFRDFSKSALDKFIGIAQEVEDEDWWDITRWDCWYRMDKCFGSLIMDFQLLSGNVDKYYRKVIDLNNASVDKIRKIFDDVYEIDNRYAATYNRSNSKLRNIMKHLERLSESIAPMK